MLQVLYKVRKIELSTLNNETERACTNLTCDFGTIIQEGGILFLEVHVFDNEKFKAIFESKNLGSLIKGHMVTFDNVEIDIPLMALIEMTSHENKLTYKCLDYITVNEEQPTFSILKLKGNVPNPSQLLRIDFWGLDLVIFPTHSIALMVSSVPFDIKFGKDAKTGKLYAYFPTNESVTHNTLTDKLFSLFRESLVSYLSLINGASVQIIREYYYSYTKIYSYNRMENISYSRYLCGNGRRFSFSSILFEFDNYVRWDKLINLNKFIHHLCSAQKLLDVEDRAFILILTFEGLCKKYIELKNEDTLPKNIISRETFALMKKKFLEILKNQAISLDSFGKLKAKIDNLNTTNMATLKFRIILDDLNIQRTPEINKLIRNVRSTLVHEAKLKEFEDYQLLSELIREIILRLINSNAKRYSDLNDEVFIGEKPGLSFQNYIEKYNLKVNDIDIISRFDESIKLRIEKIFHFR